MAAVALEFRVLGPLEALVDGMAASLGGRRQRAVLAMLLAQCNEVVPAYRLIDGVWDDEPPESAPNVLQGYVSHLRRALGREVIVTRGRDYAIRVVDGALDLHRFERLADTAAAAFAEGRPRDASAVLRDALGLWRGPALSDLVELPAVRQIAARLDELRVSGRRGTYVAPARQTFGAFLTEDWLPAIRATIEPSRRCSSSTMRTLPASTISSRPSAARDTAIPSSVRVTMPRASNERRAESTSAARTSADAAPRGRSPSSGRRR